MPIKSYLAIPRAGQLNNMVYHLNRMDGCEAIPADNREIAILVTDTANPETDRCLYKSLETLASLQCLTLVYGHEDFPKETE